MPGFISDKGTQQTNNAYNYGKINTYNGYVMGKFWPIRKHIVCNILLGKAKKQHFQKLAFKETMQRQGILDYTISYHQKCLIKRSFSLEIKNETTTKKKLLHEFDSYFTNIVQNASWRIPSKFGVLKVGLSPFKKNSLICFKPFKLTLLKAL